jgi:hypothetical protein
VLQQFTIVHSGFDGLKPEGVREKAGGIRNLHRNQFGGWHRPTLSGRVPLWCSAISRVTATTLAMAHHPFNILVLLLSAKTAFTSSQRGIKPWQVYRVRWAGDWRNGGVGLADARPSAQVILGHF